MKQLRFIFGLCCTFFCSAQQCATWTEVDRTFLTNQLVRSRDALVQETTGLTDTQWSFKEAPDRWSIQQVVAHIGV